MPVHASEMYAKNLFNFISPFIKDGALALDWEDEVLCRRLPDPRGRTSPRGRQGRARALRRASHGWIACTLYLHAGGFTGYEVISRVPVILHTPLMSGSNFVHGVVLVGGMVALGQDPETPLAAGHRLCRRAARAPPMRQAVTS
jgi:NAD/NADP transhydrogenase alpha subunit